jgi:hypothetical protein
MVRLTMLVAAVLVAVAFSDTTLAAAGYLHQFTGPATGRSDNGPASAPSPGSRTAK